MKPMASGRLSALQAAAVLACALPTGALAQQQGPRYGLAPPAPPATASALASASVPTVIRQPVFVVRPHPVVIARPAISPSAASPAAPAARGPYVTGPGQWTPEAARLDVLALQSEPGYSPPTPAAASAHWNWQRVSMADLVEMSRRNKAARSAD